jgi:hypothetical protein
LHGIDGHPHPQVNAMNVIVVYESFYGNTAEVARAIAEGIGPDARALMTDEAIPEVVQTADLVIAGAPVHAFRLPSEDTRQSTADDPKAPRPADDNHLLMRAWLEGLPRHASLGAAFETALHWSPGSSTSAILRGLEAAGYRPIAKKQRFFVAGVYGPMKAGELEKARDWGAELARLVTHAVAA